MKASDPQIILGIRVMRSRLESNTVMTRWITQTYVSLGITECHKEHPRVYPQGLHVVKSGATLTSLNAMTTACPMVEGMGEKLISQVRHQEITC